MRCGAWGGGLASSSTSTSTSTFAARTEASFPSISIKHVFSSANPQTLSSSRTASSSSAEGTFGLVGAAEVETRGDLMPATRGRATSNVLLRVADHESPDAAAAAEAEGGGRSAVGRGGAIDSGLAIISGESVRWMSSVSDT